MGLHYFGEVSNEKMVLNGIGEVVEKFWLEIPKHFPFVKLGEFVIMPNHMHGILIVQKTDAETEVSPSISAEKPYSSSVETLCEGSVETLCEGSVETLCEGSVETLCEGSVETLCEGSVETLHATSLHGNEMPHSGKNKKMATISPKKGSLGSIIRSYKSAVTTAIRKTGDNAFAWQPRYYDHIIRDRADYKRIEKYIINNPKNWESDRFNDKNK